MDTQSQKVLRQLLPLLKESHRVAYQLPSLTTYGPIIYSHIASARAMIEMTLKELDESVLP